MVSYLSSISDVVGQYALVNTLRTSDTANIPTSYFREMELLRKRVEELKDEVSSASNSINFVGNLRCDA
jgi:hypothetical protein